MLVYVFDWGGNFGQAGDDKHTNMTCPVGVFGPPSGYTLTFSTHGTVFEAFLWFSAMMWSEY